MRSERRSEKPQDDGSLPSRSTIIRTWAAILFGGIKSLYDDRVLCLKGVTNGRKISGDTVQTGQFNMRL